MEFDLSDCFGNDDDAGLAGIAKACAPGTLAICGGTSWGSGRVLGTLVGLATLGVSLTGVTVLLGAMLGRATLGVIRAAGAFSAGIGLGRGGLLGASKVSGAFGSGA